MVAAVKINAQSVTGKNHCLERWEKIIGQRGTYHIIDGHYRNVIIAYSDIYGTSCIMGKCRVAGGRVTDIWCLREDETYDVLPAAAFIDSTGAPVHNGISKSWRSLDGREYRVIFMDSVKPMNSYVDAEEDKEKDEKNPENNGKENSEDD
jgi:hypothetical protein